MTKKKVETFICDKCKNIKNISQQNNFRIYKKKYEPVDFMACNKCIQLLEDKIYELSYNFWIDC